MREVDLEKLKAQIPETEFTRLHQSDVLFRMSHSREYARALWNFTVAMMDAECDDLATAYEVISTSKDLTHLCGFHKLRFDACRWAQLRWFLTRVWQNQEMLSLKPQLKSYIEFLVENSKIRAGKYSRPIGLIKSYGGRGWLPWRTEDWYADRYESRRRSRPAPLTEFWPYITGSPTDEHDLLLAVDGLVPRFFPNDVRSDICQEMIVAILSGDTTLENLRDGRVNYINELLKQMPSKYGHLSLDAPLSAATEYVTVGETVRAHC